MPRLVAVFDIDGTLANHNHRAAILQKRCSVCLHEPVPVGHHVPCPTCGSTISTPTQESWDAFLDSDLMAQDPVIVQGLEVLEKLRTLGAEIHYITGRTRALTGEVTADWLKFKCGRTESELLIMREPEDLEPASGYKEKAYKRLVEQIGSDGVFFFFEDDPHVFPVYDKYGIVVRCPQGLQHFMPPGPRYAEQDRNI
jgi:hypothetical protein